VASAPPNGDPMTSAGPTTPRPHHSSSLPSRRPPAGGTRAPMALGRLDTWRRVPADCVAIALETQTVTGLPCKISPQYVWSSSLTPGSPSEKHLFVGRPIEPAKGLQVIAFCGFQREGFSDTSAET
jgi:hypothetical protein